MRHRFSYGVWARQLGIRSPSALIMIVKGQRHPSDKLVQKIAQQMHLGRREAQFFSDLVALKKERELSLQVLLLERLKSRQRGGKFTSIRRDTFTAISHWYFAAIREMVGLNVFREDDDWIWKAFLSRVSPREVRAAIAILLRLRILKRDSRGRLRSTDQHLETMSDVADLAVRNFHKEILGCASASLDSTPLSEREFLGSTFALPKSNLPRAKALLRKFHDEFCDLLEEPDADSIYHIEMAFFPLANLSRPETDP